MEVCFSFCLSSTFLPLHITIRNQKLPWGSLAKKLFLLSSLIHFWTCFGRAVLYFPNTGWPYFSCFYHLLSLLLVLITLDVAGFEVVYSLRVQALSIQIACMCCMRVIFHSPRPYVYFIWHDILTTKYFIFYSGIFVIFKGEFTFLHIFSVEKCFLVSHKGHLLVDYVAYGLIGSIDHARLFRLLFFCWDDRLDTFVVGTWWSVVDQFSYAYT